jgi:class 3 adenylate cyclase/putative methionine-R-sulfoxide reductase with GAF domain
MGDASSLLDRNDLLTLLDATQALKETRTLQDALTRILEVAGALMHSSAGSVILHDHQRNDLYFAAATGPAKDDLSKIRIPIGKGKAGEVFESGNAIVENTVEDHYKRVDEKTDFATKSMICVPLTRGDRRLGVMQMLNKSDGAEPFNDRDVELLTRFAVQATLAIHDARLFEQMIGSSGLHARPDIRRDLIGLITSDVIKAVQESLTILYVDLRGFSRLCNLIARPQRIQDLLNEYVSCMAALVVHHGGIVNKVMGDGIISIFRGADSAVRAVYAAIDLLEQFDQLRQNWGDRVSFTIDFLDIGIGIATDEEMILGTVGDQSFRDVSLIGQGVNLAARLMDEARDGKRILCDRMTRGKLRSHETDAKFEITSAIRLAGGKHGTASPEYDVFEIRPIKPKISTTPAASASGEFDIFISYRRDGGSAEARCIQATLKDHYGVFLDVDTLPAGHFDESLLRVIESTRNFVVLLSKGSLDRTYSEGDWLRREIAHAIKTTRNIVPVMLPGFSFPNAQALPEEIRDLVRFDAVEYNHRYFYPTIEKIREHLVK